MNDAQTAIVNLIQSKEFKECISKIEPMHLQDDLAAEVSLILLETEPDKIIALAAKDHLKFYAVRIIMNLAFSNTSPFYNKYRKPAINSTEYRDELDSVVDTSTEDIRQKQLEHEAILAIDDLYWYYADMVKLYLKVGTFRGMQREVLIPYNSCCMAIDKAAKQIKKKIG